MGRRRWSRVVIVLIVVVAAAYVAADLVTLQLAESRASNEFAQATAAERVRVSFGGFPFLPGLLGGNLREVDIEARGISGGGLRVAQLHANVADVQFSPSGALKLIRSQHAPRVRVRGQATIGRAEVTQHDLQEFLRLKRQFVRDVRIIPEGVEVRFEFPAGTVTPPVRFYPRMNGTKLTLVLVALPEGLPKQLEAEAREIQKTIDIPHLPKGVSVDLRLGRDSFVLEASGPSLDVRVGEGGLTSS